MQIHEKLNQLSVDAGAIKDRFYKDGAYGDYYTLGSRMDFYARLLGRGLHASVYTFDDTTAVKLCRNASSDGWLWWALTCSTVSYHPGILKDIDVLIDAENNTYIATMPVYDSISRCAESGAVDCYDLYDSMMYDDYAGRSVYGITNDCIKLAYRHGVTLSRDINPRTGNWMRYTSESMPLGWPSGCLVTDPFTTNDRRGMLKKLQTAVNTLNAVSMTFCKNHRTRSISYGERHDRRDRT